MFRERRLAQLVAIRCLQKQGKLVYEYETFCNQSAYLYPAMAKFYRSVGAQIATQWTYGLTAYSEYLGGSHVFNLKTTPRKAASFMVAKQQFKDVGTTFSFESRSSAVLQDRQLIYSGWSESDDWSDSVFGSDLASPTSIIGVGDSPFVRYEGEWVVFYRAERKWRAAPDAHAKCRVYPPALERASHR